MSKKIFLKKFSILEYIIAASIFIFLSVFLLHHLNKIKRGPLTRLNYLMEQIVNKVDAGYSKNEIMESFTQSQKKFLLLHKVNWNEGVFPIKFSKGFLSKEYYPHDHVVVYANPLVGTSQKYRVGKFYTAKGEVHGRSDFNDVQKLVELTHIGTKDILLSQEKDFNSILSQFKDDDLVIVYEYLLLKELLNENELFLKYCIEIASKNLQHYNSWVNKILQSSVEYPELPIWEISHENKEIFHNSLSKWYEKNKGQIEFNNQFLFEDDASISINE